MDYTAATALVTGASSGIGAGFARRLAARGADVVLVARRADRLTDLAAEIRRDHGVDATVLPLDLGVADAGSRLREALGDRRVDVLVNNAGFGLHGPFVGEDPARLESMLQLNVTALTSITRAFAPAMAEAGSGAIVNVASTAAYQSTPHFAAYAASKAYVLSFTEALAFELRGSGVKVLALSPGATRTEFFDTVGEDAAFGRMQSVDAVVGTALAALDRRRTPPSVVSGVLNRAVAASVGATPRRLALAMTGRLVG